MKAQRGEQTHDSVWDAGTGRGEHLVLAERRAGGDVEPSSPALELPRGMEAAQGFPREPVRLEIAWPEDSPPPGQGEEAVPGRTAPFVDVTFR